MIHAHSRASIGRRTSRGPRLAEERQALCRARAVATGFVALLGVGLGCNGGCKPDAENPTTEYSIPDPPLDDVEPQVAQVVAEAHSAVMRRPESLEAWGAYGEVLDAHRMLAEAETCYRRAWSLAPDEFRWTYLLATVLDDQEGRQDEAISMYETAARIKPNYATTWVRLGLLLHTLGRTTEAREALEKALEIREDVAIAHRTLGEVLIGMGRTDQALDHLETAAAMYPDDRKVQAALARTYERAGEPTRARAAAEKARRLEVTIPIPDPIRYPIMEKNISTRRLQKRAKRQMQSGDFAAAIENLKIVTDARSEDPSAHFLLAKAYHGVGKQELTLRHLQTAVRIRDEFIPAHLLLGIMYMKRGDPGQAVEHLRRARRHDAKHPEVALQLATALGMHGDLDEAIGEFERAVELNPNSAALHVNWGNVLLKKRDRREAVAHFHEALRIDPEFIDAHYNLALVLEQIGRSDEAIEHYRHVTSVRPRHPAAGRLARLESVRP